MGLLRLSGPLDGIVECGESNGGTRPLVGTVPDGTRLPSYSRFFTLFVGPSAHGASEHTILVDILFAGSEIW